MPASISQYAPQCAASVPARDVRRRALVVWGVIACGALAFVGLVLSAPLALAGGHDGWAGVVYGGFHVACHQIPERSFYLAGHPLAVCARCTGIYMGFAAGVLVYPLARSIERRDAPARAWLILGALPLALDFALGFFGVWENTHLSRLLTGALLGAVVGFYIVPGLFDFVQTGWRTHFQARA